MAKRIIRLTESELIDLVRRTINEAEMDPEPVIVGNGKIFGYFLFPEGKAVPNSLNGRPLIKADYEGMSQQIADYIRKTGMLKVLEKFGVPNIKQKFITIHVGTSHTGSPSVNDELSQKREKFLENLVRRAFDILGISDDNIGSLIMTNRDTRYEPSKINKLYDPNKLKPKSSERFGDIEVKQLGMRGLEPDEITSVGSNLKDASSYINNYFIDNVDEEKIQEEIYKLASPSDVKTLNKNIDAYTNWDGLEDFLNDQLFDDGARLKNIASHLDKIATDFFGESARGTVRIVKGGISIGPALTN